MAQLKVQQTLRFAASLRFASDVSRKERWKRVGEVIDSAKYFWVPFGITLMMMIIMATDGYDLMAWISKQAWSNGKVGTTGCSSTAC